MKKIAVMERVAAEQIQYSNTVHYSSAENIVDYKKYRYDLTRQKQISNALNTHLLHEEHGPIHKPLTPWARELVNEIQVVTRSLRRYQSVQKIADIYSQAAFIFLAIGDFQSARDLCYSQIQLFINLSAKMHKNEYLKYVFKPWIGLISIDTAEGSYRDALAKLNILSSSHQHEPIFSENKLVTDKLVAMIHHQVDIRAMVIDAGILESIKIYLAANFYDDLLNFLSEYPKPVNKLLHSVMLEAEIVALANTGRIRAARQVLEQAKLDISPGYQHIFNLRDIELKSAFPSRIHTTSDINDIVAIANDSLQAKYICVNDVLYALRVASLLKFNDFLEESKKLYYYCLEAATSLSDERLKAESLLGLYEIIHDEQGKRLIENLMVEVYYKSQYEGVRTKLLHVFSDLHYVESKYDYSAMIILFEELMLFSSLSAA